MHRARRGPAIPALRPALRHTAHPVLLLAAAATVAVAIRTEAWFPLVNFGFAVFAFGYLAVLERIIPYDRTWHPARWEWRRDGMYCALALVGGGLARGGILSLGSVVAPPHARLPLGVEIAVAVGVMSLCSYGYHRLSHRVPWLWKMHGVHHAPHKINVANHHVHQFLDAALHLVVSHLPLVLLGLSQPAVFAAIVFRVAQSYGAHANIDVALGWLNYLVVGPEPHRLHHSPEPHELGHYALDLPVWDLAFGSFTWKPARAPRRVGLRHPASFPTPRSILVNQLFAFRRAGYLERTARVGLAIDR
ncbi:MAG TPA: sterol desaturase family protein [Kofleriaceae bacterium]|nr:sterol desaturase family protein [Kofleriaceae bacterium]